MEDKKTEELEEAETQTADQPKENDAPAEQEAPQAEAPEAETPQAEAEAEAPIASQEEAPTETPVEEEAPEVEAQPQERMFTQSELNEIVGKTRQEGREKGIEEGRALALSELNEKYGVDDESALDSLFGDGQRYTALNQEYDVQNKKLKELEAENVLLKSGIDKEKFDDVKAILAYKHLDVTPEAVEQELLTHPEWNASAAPLAAEPMPSPESYEKPSLIKKLGGLPSSAVTSDKSLEEEEKQKAMSLMGLPK